jgi:hypothetical protein
MADYDFAELSNIYQDAYYTPALEATDKDAAFGAFYSDFLEKLSLMPGELRGRGGGRRRTFLEIGCSMGSMLGILHQDYPNDAFIGIDPDRKNIEFAAEHLKNVTCKLMCGFFPDVFSDSVGLPYLGDSMHVYSRHVIEHVENPLDFFASQVDLAGVRTVALETPCSDLYLDAGSAMDPFHVEHLHVFSIASLALLLQKSPLAKLSKYNVNDYGDAMVGLAVADSMQSRDSYNSNLESFRLSGKKPDVLCRKLVLANEKHIKRIERIRRFGRKVVFWGAGSQCASLLSFGLKPLAIFDGNMNKAGKYMPGFKEPIIHANRENLSRFNDCHLVISTSFRKSVLKEIDECGVSFRSVSSLWY